jgi:arylsulfatase A-like enzyme
MDLLPTFAQLAGVGLPSGLALDGASIADILLGNSSTSSSNSSSSSKDRPIFFYRGNMLYAVRNDVN